MKNKNSNIKKIMSSILSIIMICQPFVMADKQFHSVNKDVDDSEIIEEEKKNVIDILTDKIKERPVDTTLLGFGTICFLYTILQVFSGSEDPRRSNVLQYFSLQEHQPLDEDDQERRPTVLNIGAKNCGKTKFLKSESSKLGCNFFEVSKSKNLGYFWAKYYDACEPLVLDAGEKSISDFLNFHEIVVIRIFFDLSIAVGKDEKDGDVFMRIFGRKIDEFDGVIKTNVFYNVGIMFVGCKSDEKNNGLTDEKINSAIEKLSVGKETNSKGEVIRPIIKPDEIGNNLFFKTSTKNESGIEGVIGATKEWFKKNKNSLKKI
ncbi:MAG: hypothetical protein CfP315_0545 [Candidatus Improbicoccus pseudotrichonymphae]|uniref:Signal recognition particle receptor subunit beta n=1 Tax=Candidatus Improbicoccus pseudotrichonymphae TaxID=3033792 RepID=A0AA48HYD3_9FIRM|nr:MAG: hypothetical protein CfP315_0545 [Candidatus Improbicoccus pseudotrichonymphae]